MKTITVSDKTLRKAASRTENALSFKEKIEIAKQLDRLMVDTIELDAIENVQTDTILIKTIAAVVKNSAISCVVGLSEEEIDRTWNAIREACKPVLNFEIPLSPAQLEFVAHIKPRNVMDKISQLVKYCAAKGAEVTFTAVDATRTEKEFLLQAIDAAIAAGADRITVCDTAGTMFPEEFAGLVGEIIAHCAGKNVRFAVECADEMNMATASVFSAIQAGADEAVTAVGGGVIPSLTAFAHAMQMRGDSRDTQIGLKMTEIKRCTEQVRALINTKRSATSPFDNAVGTYADRDEIAPTADITTVLRKVTELGYELSEEDSAKVYEAFKRVSAKKTVNMKELDAIVASAALQVPDTYKLVSYVINSGNVINATAHLVMNRQENAIDGLSMGDGPIDAAFLAIEKITGHHYELDDFQIQAVTEGREAMGEALVKLRSKGKLFSGRGISTDIIGASIHAYVSALNKIVYEENV